jgi:diadenosine tetraphosphatase ApaH/serine/threonine PP2A family protein phosphatase
MMVVNAGSVGIPYDGDPRALYALLDENGSAIRRIEYNVNKEVKALDACGLRSATWVAKRRVRGSVQMP